MELSHADYKYKGRVAEVRVKGLALVVNDGLRGVP